jgi:hypothetical protein
MFEIAQDLEQTARNLRPAILVGLGLVSTVAGLFIWLGGLGLRKLLAVVVGTAGGAICGFCAAGQKTMPVILSAGIGAAAALVLENVFIVIMAAGLAAACGFAVLAEVHKADFSEGFKQACFQMPAHTWIIIAALAAGFIVAGFYLRRFVSALCCATLGTLLVFAGMILLLSQKGAAPLASIRSRTHFYAAVFVAMTAFGTSVQLLLCQRIRRQPAAKRQASKDEENPEEKRANWRTQ